MAGCVPRSQLITLTRPRRTSTVRCQLSPEYEAYLLSDAIKTLLSFLSFTVPSPHRRIKILFALLYYVDFFVPAARTWSDVNGTESGFHSPALQSRLLQFMEGEFLICCLRNFLSRVGGRVSPNIEQTGKG